MFWNAEETPCCHPAGWRNLHGCGHRKERLTGRLCPQVHFSGPKHLCIDPVGNVIIADDNNHLIRLYDPKTNQVSTILGGKAQPRTQLNRPHGVAISPDGTLWICDSWNDRVLTLKDY